MTVITHRINDDMEVQTLTENNVATIVVRGHALFVQPNDIRPLIAALRAAYNELHPPQEAK